MQDRPKIIGTKALHLSFPVWPLPTNNIIYRTRLEGAVLILSGLPSGQFKIEIRDAITDQVLLECASSVLSINKPENVKIAFAWDVPHRLQVFCNTLLIASLEHPERVPEVQVLPHDSTKPKERDFSRENLLAIKRRHDRFMGHQPRPKRTRAGFDYILSSLENEINQIEDLLGLIKNGKTFHAAGLASRLRLLLIEGDPLPHLQLCAASVGKLQLLVYTSVADEMQIQENGVSLPPATALNFNISHVPRGDYINEIDVDVWLNTVAGRDDGQPFTHYSILKAIGDTVGSHIDRDIHPLVVMLRRSDSDFNGKNLRDLMIDYIGHVATEIMPLLKWTLKTGKEKLAAQSK